MFIEHCLMLQLEGNCVSFDWSIFQIYCKRMREICRFILPRKIVFPRGLCALNKFIIMRYKITTSFTSYRRKNLILFWIIDVVPHNILRYKKNCNWKLTILLSFILISNIKKWSTVKFREATLRKVQKRFLQHSLKCGV